jgi:hypothetical protein
MFSELEVAPHLGVMGKVESVGCSLDSEATMGQPG